MLADPADGVCLDHVGWCLVNENLLGIHNSPATLDSELAALDIG